MAGWQGGPSALRLRKLGYSSADQVLAIGGMFVVNLALARARSREEYGIFTLSYSVFTFLAGLYNAALLEAYTIYGSGRYHGSLRAYEKLLWRANAWFSTGLTALLLSVWLALHWLFPALASPATEPIPGVQYTGSYAPGQRFVIRVPRRWNGSLIVAGGLLITLWRA